MTININAGRFQANNNDIVNYRLNLLDNDMNFLKLATNYNNCNNKKKVTFLFTINL